MERALAQGGLFSDLMGTAMRDADKDAEQYLIENAKRSFNSDSEKSANDIRNPEST